MYAFVQEKKFNNFAKQIKSSDPDATWLDICKEADKELPCWCVTQHTVSIDAARQREGVSDFDVSMSGVGIKLEVDYVPDLYVQNLLTSEMAVFIVPTDKIEAFARQLASDQGIFDQN